ncbi:MAG TPA: Slp family lipoprotein [Rudaea sp.]|jgi:outer membrane lipoprotein|nr:Slp family lipoprotein [Rudaea sp.]HSC13174.1 Slp family lipoprotein [Rhodanobacteraceae bacterium]
MPNASDFARYGAAALTLFLVACAPPPVLKPTQTPQNIAPDMAAAMPDVYRGAEILWGGRIVEVRNRAETSEIVILAYPLDGGQRPRPKEPGQGRFIAVLEGYVESYDYPHDRFVTVSGKVDGSLSEIVDEQPYVYTVVRAEGVHLWPAGFENSAPQVHFSIGVSGGIR